MSKIIVFLGPTLSLIEAKKILPNACYAAPGKCGDILHLLRQKPDVIAIIDGYFEQTAAVWHKEILYAMQHSVRVYGASSMGALRASELHAYGMQGVGKIFEQYCDGRLEADDEVAIAHLDEKNSYKSLSDAMVNIRATLDAALAESIITQDSYQEIISDLKAKAYSERNLMQYLNRCHNVKAYSHLKTWLHRVGMCDQKRQDALLLLSELRTIKNNYKVSSSLKNLPSSMFFKALHHKIQCDCFDTDYAWLSNIERATGFHAKAEPLFYNQIKRLAALLSVAYQLSDERECIYQSLLPTVSTDSEVIEVINSYICRVMPRDTLIKQIKNYFSIIDEYTQENQNNILYYSAVVWAAILEKIHSLNVAPQGNEIIEFSNKFRQNKQLLSMQSFEEWLKDNGLSLDAYQGMIVSAYWFDFIVARFNIDVLTKGYKENQHWWFSIALNMVAASKDIELELGGLHQSV